MTCAALVDPQASPLTTDASPPCFYWRVCGSRAAVEKQGKSVCPACATRLKGTAYPLRVPTRAPLYSSSRAAAAALDMVEKRRKKRDPIEQGNESE